MKEILNGKIKFRVETSIKKYKEIDGYTFHAYSVGSALSHIAYKLSGKASQYDVHKAHRKGKIRLVIC